MNARSLAATLFGVGGVWMLAQLLIGCGSVVDLVVREAGEETSFTPGFGLMLAGYLVCGLLLLFGREELALRLFPDEDLDLPAADVLLDVGFRLVGLLILARGLEQLAFAWATNAELFKVGAGNAAQTVAGVLISLFGLAVCVGARPLVTLLRRARTAGLNAQA